MKHEDEGGLGPSFHEWEREVPFEVTRDSLWLVEAYRLALYLGDLAWRDAIAAMKDRHAVHIADQLRRAASKISASIAEGYSRDSGKARSTYYEYALGSARESRDWYYNGITSRVTYLRPHSYNTASRCARRSSG